MFWERANAQGTLKSCLGLLYLLYKLPFQFVTVTYDSCKYLNWSFQEWFRYVSDFMHSYKGLAPRFLLAFHSLLSHDSINLVQVADDDTVAHLKHLYETGELEKSLVIVMADHGNRFAKLRSTHQGTCQIFRPQFFFIIKGFSAAVIIKSVVFLPT